MCFQVIVYEVVSNYYFIKYLSEYQHLSAQLQIKVRCEEK